MTFEELDIALEELETRLERLRALYEQYFLGFEKIEPQVARKDVDRRIYLLRREKIRNTGKRFKLQTIIQRYNTFQQYWQRICREIENGTYKRHLARAERILGADQMLTIAARRRFGKAAAERVAAGAEDEAAAEVGGGVSPSDDGDDDRLTVPVQASHVAALQGQSLQPAPLPPVPRPASSSTTPPVPARSARPSKFESLDLDMESLDWDPASSLQPRPKPAPSPAAPKAPPPKPVARPQPPPKPAAAPKAAPRAAAPRPPVADRPAVAAKPEKPAGSTSASSLTDDRIRELHEKLVRIKRENREAGQVSVESLAKTLRATEEKLRADHKNRRIEFDVVLKDGKAVVKPKVR